MPSIVPSSTSTSSDPRASTATTTMSPPSPDPPPPPPHDPDRATPQSSSSLLQKIGAGFSSLKDCSPELVAIMLVKILESFNYFSLSITTVDYLSSEFGVSDVRAGSIYGLWGTLLTVYGVACGPVVDAAGIRWCLVASALSTGIARTILALTRSKGLALFSFFVPAAVGGALGVPVLTIGVKRTSPPHARGFAFSIFYWYVCLFFSFFFHCALSSRLYSLFFLPPFFY